jgi:hypothetical protein
MPKFSNVSPKVPSGEEFRRKQLEEKQQTNLKRKEVAKKTANPPKGVQSITGFLRKK